MRKSKIKEIESFYKQNFDSLLKDYYLEKEMSGIEIASRFFKDSGIKLSPRAIQRQLKDLGIVREKRFFSASY